jgi:hypothetical protein
METGWQHTLHAPACSAPVLRWIVPFRFESLPRQNAVATPADSAVTPLPARGASRLLSACYQAERTSPLLMLPHHRFIQIFGSLPRQKAAAIPGIPPALPYHLAGRSPICYPPVPGCRAPSVNLRLACTS